MCLSTDGCIKDALGFLCLLCHKTNVGLTKAEASTISLVLAYTLCSGWFYGNK